MTSKRSTTWALVAALSSALAVLLVWVILETFARAQDTQDILEAIRATQARESDVVQLISVALSCEAAGAETEAEFRRCILQRFKPKE